MSYETITPPQRMRLTPCEMEGVRFQIADCRLQIEPHLAPDAWLRRRESWIFNLKSKIFILKSVYTPFMAGSQINL
jgi:hypothetical protein